MRINAPRSLYEINRIMVLESVESIGVRTVPLSHYLYNYNGSNKGYNGKVIIARHSDFKDKVDIQKLNDMSQFAVDLFGYQYDNKEIVRIMARIVASKFGFKKGKIRRNKEYICSEYAHECFKVIGINFKYDRCGFIAPVDFAKEKKVRPVVALKVMG